MDAFSQPLAVLLLQWTLLLALAWGCQFILRQRHPRWRQILWRSVLCFGLALPLVSLLRFPRFNIPAPRFVAAPLDHSTAGPAIDAILRSGAASPISRQMPSVAPIQETQPGAAVVDEASNTRMPWSIWLSLGWVAGCGWEAFRLLRLHRRLRGIARQATAAGPELESLAREIQTGLHVARPVQVRISGGISAPFLCGVFQPVILLPRRLVDEISHPEIVALLSHEMAHQRRHDLAWCIGWRFMKVVHWFHPLVWRAPEAHVLACEEEADRIAAGRAYEGMGYAQLLGQLALRVLRVSAGENPLALHASSHLSRRLIQLGRERLAAWRLRHSIMGCVAAMGLLVLTAGWQFVQAASEKGVATTTETGGTKVVATKSVPMEIETKTVVVTIQDEQGKPIEGATISLDGLRAGGALNATHFSWRGPLAKVVTNREGSAEVQYPVFINAGEKLLTSEISFLVAHADFSTERPTHFSVDGTAKPIRMKRGIPLRVAGYFGARRESVAEISPTIKAVSTPGLKDGWQREADGAMSWRNMSPGEQFLHVSGRLTSGELVYSDGVAFVAENREGHDFALELKPGVRVVGRVDSNVLRPVQDGWVQLSVHDTAAAVPDRIADNTGFWFSYRPIAADGTFVFESVPRGELKVIAYGKRFVSANGVDTQGKRGRTPTQRVPQSFSPTQANGAIEVATEATVILTVVVKNDGQPVAGARIAANPNVVMMPTGSRIFAGTRSSSEARLRDMPVLPDHSRNYYASTDEAGIAVLGEVPAFTGSVSVTHERFEIPIRYGTNRSVALSLTPGQAELVEVSMQPKGKEFIGSNTSPRPSPAAALPKAN